MEAYSAFAELYDSLMQDVPYEQLADLIEKQIKKYNIQNPMVLDLACGTGTLTGLLSNKGFDMIGADLSQEMLQVAQRKNPDILFLNQSMDDFELYGTVGTICCCLDSVNYLTEDGALDKLFQLCNNYLEPDGLLIFDVNSEYKFKHILADNIYNSDTDCIFYSWENFFMEEEKLCDFYLTFFVKEGELYRRYDETHTERCYSRDEICQALKQNGFSIEAVFDGFSEEPAHEESERLFFVCKNIDSIQLKHCTEDA